MSIEIVILIISIIFILLALVGSIKVKGSSHGLLSANLRIPLGILGVLMLIFAGYSYEAVTLPSKIEKAELGNVKQVDLPINKVQILSPVDGDSVKCRILSMGVYPTSHEKDIWVVLKPSDKRYYPQSDHTNTSYKRNGEWQVITRFGGDKGEVYEIIIYETESSASQYFSSTIESWKKMESYPGLELADIPVSAYEIDRIKVSLKEHCRGVH